LDFIQLASMANIRLASMIGSATGTNSAVATGSLWPIAGPSAMMASSSASDFALLQTPQIQGCRRGSLPQHHRAYSCKNARVEYASCSQLCHLVFGSTVLTALPKLKNRRWAKSRMRRREHAEVQVETADSAASTNYSWSKQWYPVTALSILRDNGPHPIKLLGKDLVLWRDSGGSWRCSAGICPHRLAPLARGRVNQDGSLMCRFHGWCFNGDGTCVKVPMAEGDAEAEKLLVGTASTKLASYPTKESKGLLFVWADPDSEEEATNCEPFMMKELGDSPNWSVFDAPAGWRVWMEQTWDPSHAPFLHQFTLPNFAPENAAAMEKFNFQSLGDEGFFCRAWRIHVRQSGPGCKKKVCSAMREFHNVCLS